MCTGEALNDFANFDIFGNACLLLFQCLTNDAWSGLMADAMIEAHTGKCSDAEGNCGSWMAIPYFISFQVLGSFVLLNLIVAIILESFTTLGKENPKLVSADDIDAFKEAWAFFDPDADKYIPARDLPKLCLALPPPIGMKGQAHSAAVRACVNLVHVVRTYSAVQQYKNKTELESLLHDYADHLAYACTRVLVDIIAMHETLQQAAIRDHSTCLVRPPRT